MRTEHIDCKVVMLPQGKTGYSIGDLCKKIAMVEIGYDDDELIGTLSIAVKDYTIVNNYWQAQHAYFTSDEEIKEGDWYYFPKLPELRQCKSKIEAIGVNNVRPEWCIKVIASTDPSLGLPSISEQWIRTKYVPSNGSINEVKISTKTNGGHPTLEVTSCHEVVIVENASEKNVDAEAKMLNEIMEKAYKRYGTDIHSFGQQRDGYVEGYREGRAEERAANSNEAVEFLLWVEKSPFAYNPYTETYDFDIEEATPQELYKMFKEQKAKQQA